MKEYLLLRNNAQSGPYTFDELRAIGLRAYDLIWVENKSFSWKYPSEVKELADFAPPLEEISGEPLGRELTHLTVDMDDLARVLPGVKRENKENATKAAASIVNHHVVAFKPKIDHVEIRTIKSTSQPNVVKVQVRKKSGGTMSSNNMTAIIGGVDEQASPEMDPSVPVSSMQEEQLLKSSYFNQPVPSVQRIMGNKLEMIVLAIGAASLMAVIYLLLTTGYQY
ncbi:MAG: hypothetical protein KF746_04090 [Chitinophagaceae bacterium]|nr:hypothetical protein [Chitinophagaceae bacterium]